MRVHWDKKKDKRLISFLYNSNFFTALTINPDLELISNQTSNFNSFNLIDYRMNSVGLDEMASKIENTINNSIASIINGALPAPIDQIQSIINFILSNPANYNTQPTEQNIANHLNKGLEHYFHKNTLKDDEFNWISINNPRLVNFVWASLRMCSFSQTKSNISITYELNNSINLKTALETNWGSGLPGNLYRNLHLETNPPDSRCKLESIKLFFDSLGEPLLNQKTLMSLIKNKWDLIKNRIEVIEWLNKNEILITWSWSYIVDSLLNKITPEWVDISSSDEIEIQQKIKDTIITLYDLLDRESEKKLFKGQLSRNGSQQKYREKEKSNSKILNICISIETKEKLDKLKNAKRCTIKEIIETLIDSEFKKQGL